MFVSGWREVGHVPGTRYKTPSNYTGGRDPVVSSTTYGVGRMAGLLGTFVGKSAVTSNPQHVGKHPTAANPI